jgi:hypothetical protein
MGTTIWSGATSGNWNDDTNWSGVKPIDNDTAVFPAGGTVSVTTGPTVSIDLDLLYIHPLFTGHIGTSGSPISLAADLIEHHGAGGLYVESNNGGAAELIDEVRIMCAAPDVEVQIGGDAGAKGEVTAVYVLRGHVTMKANTNYNAAAIVEVGHMGNVQNDAKVILLHDSVTPANTTIPVFHQWGGRCWADAIITAGRLAAGTLVKREAKAVALDIYGGVCEYNHTSIDADNTILKVRNGGVLDLMQTHNAKYFDELWIYGGGKAKVDDHLHTYAAGYPKVFGSGQLIKV